MEFEARVEYVEFLSAKESLLSDGGGSPRLGMIVKESGEASIHFLCEWQSHEDDRRRAMIDTAIQDAWRPRKSVS